MTNSVTRNELLIYSVGSLVTLTYSGECVPINSATQFTGRHAAQTLNFSDVGASIQ